MNKDKQRILKKYKEQIQEAIKELKTKGKRHRQIPNILTTIRLLSPCLILPSATTGNIPLTIGLAVGFGLTDLADGFIAKNWNLTSELGKDLDAVTDKVFAGTLLLASSIINPVLLVNFALEGAIAAVNVNQKLSGKETESTKTGKIKTWLVFSLGAIGLVAPLLGMPALLPIFSAATAAMQCFTLASYVSKYKKTKLNSQKTKQQSKKTSVLGEIKNNEKTNQKNKNQEHFINSITSEESLNAQLAELKTMSDFFRQEQTNLSGKTKLESQENEIKKPKTFQKNNKSSFFK